jgi:hypothetical protein
MPRGNRSKPGSRTPPAVASAQLDEQLANLTRLTAPQLRREWQRLYRIPAPTRLSLDLLMRFIAYRIQELTFGGLSQSVHRQLQSLGRAVAKEGSSGIQSSRSLKPGAKLLREWRGQTHTVLVLEDGFSYCDQHYDSLTKIAQRITGAHWSGPRFFGVGPRKDSVHAQVSRQQHRS